MRVWFSFQTEEALFTALKITYTLPTYPFDDDTSFCFGINVGYRTLLAIGNKSI